MVTKNKGYKTKERILDCAKEEFYEHGYRNTTVQAIAEKASLRLGNLNYYFGKKDDLVEEIYKQFIGEIFDFIESKGQYSALEKYGHFTFIIYSIILSDQKNRRFYHEVIFDKSNYRVIHNLMVEYYQKIIVEEEIAMNEKELEIFILTEFGSRHEIFLAFLEGRLELVFEDLVYYVLNNMCKNLGIPLDEIRQLIDASQQFLLENDYSHIRFLR